MLRRISIYKSALYDVYGYPARGRIMCQRPSLWIPLVAR